jgi:RimJ/RimL family protein N-acetyltransferase
MCDEPDGLSYRPVEPRDLELILAWRSNPEVYERFREQDGPLTWKEHLKWYGSRPDDRHDYVIVRNGRRVGVVSLSPDSQVGVYVGETASWGSGIGSSAVEWLCETHDRDRFVAEIHVDNDASRRLFERCSFDQFGTDGKWAVYRRPGNE